MKTTYVPGLAPGSTASQLHERHNGDLVEPRRQGLLGKPADLPRNAGVHAIDAAVDSAERQNAQASITAGRVPRNAAKSFSFAVPDPA